MVRREEHGQGSQIGAGGTSTSRRQMIRGRITPSQSHSTIDRIMRGSLDQREMEDIGDNTLSFSEVKAIASGDPLILERAEVEQEVTTLTRLERSHARAQSGLRALISLAEREIEQGRHALTLGFTHATPAWILIGFLERRSRMTRSTREVASSDYSRTFAPAADWKLLVRVRGRSRSRSILCPRPRQGRRGGAARGQV